MEISRRQMKTIDDDKYKKQQKTIQYERRLAEEKEKTLGENY